MNERWQSWIKKAKSILTFITDRKTVKGARITYSVVWNLFLLSLTVIIIGGAFAVGVGAGYFASLVKDEPIRSYESMKKDIYNYTETSQLYFAHDDYLGKLRTDLEREEVRLDQVSDYLIKAVVATEDEYFYKHNGVVPKAVFRALFQEVTNSAVQSGGSTLTQQLIKNQILTNEVSFQRKANEILLALRLEKFFDKKEILEAYLNVSAFGRNSSGKNIAGVQAAAKGIFGKNASDVTLPQAAFIAGLPQSPFGYTPFTKDATIKKHLEPGLTRMKTVLKRMYDNGYINEKQYQDAARYDITKDFISPVANPTEKYPWLTFEIEKRAKEVLTNVLAEKDGYTEADLKKDDSLLYKYKSMASHDLQQNGYKIYTTIDKKIYDAMQKAKDQYQWYGPDKPEKIVDPETGEKKTVMEPVQVGAMLIENKTGKIISFVGGRKYDSEHQLNHATNAIRQNGSTMKPLLVYGPAIEFGKASPGTTLPDVALSLKPGSSSPWPHNYNSNSYSGLVSARNALAKSYNVPAVKLYKDIIHQKPAKYLEKMGFTSLTKEDYTNLATSIGSMTNGVTIEENTNAFSTFANGGKFIDAYMIDKIVDKNGKIVYQHKVKPVDVFKPQTAYLTLDMMRDVIKTGTAAGIRSKLNFSADWAGKTGTGNQYIDSWFVATNPNVTFGIWQGYDKPKSLQTYGMRYSQRTNNLWAQLMNAAYKNRPDLIAPKQSFKMPGGIVRRSYCAVSGMLPSAACAKAGLIESDYFNVNHVPAKVDDSLIEGKFVTVGDKRYLALDSTPKEFAQFGLILNPDFIKRMVGNNFYNYSQLIPQGDRWGKILVSTSKMVDNGKKPNPVNLKASGNTLTWSAATDKDVVGYRIYRGGSKVASVVNGSKRSFAAGNGSYHVTAVDIAGKESAPSNSVKIEAANKQDVKAGNDKQKEKTKEKSAETTKKKAENKQKDQPA